MKTRVRIPIVIALALVAAACGGSDDIANTSEAEGGAETVEAVATAEPAPTEVQVAGESDPAPTDVPAPAPTEDPTEEPTEASTPDTTDTAEQSDEPAAVAGSALTSGCGAGTVAGITTATFEFEGVERVYEQVVPASYDDTSPSPVVLNWHGLGSNGVEQVGFSDYAALAETEGFIVIAATGLPDDADRNSWELTAEQFPERDDLAFANALLDRVIETLCADASRVYTTGMSNGGYFSSVLVCEMSDRIAAAASVAALSHADDCDPARVVPYIGFHGTNDEVVPFDGSGESSLAPGVIVPLFQLKILDEFTEFAVQAGCDADPAVAEFSPEVTSYDFANCADGASMTFYEIEGGGHTWPGSTVSLALSEALGLGATTDEINASETSWAFFEQYALDS